MRIHKFITYFVKLLLSTRCRGASLLYMAAEEMFGKRVIVTVHGECEIIRGKGTAENERLRNAKFIFSYPKNERLIFLGGSNAAQEEISTMRVGRQPADRCTSLSALCVGWNDPKIECMGIGRCYK